MIQNRILIRALNLKFSISLAKKKKIIYLLIGLLLLISAVFSLIYLKKKKDAKRLFAELRRENFAHYEELRNNLADFDNYFGKTMTDKLKSLEEVMTAAYNPNQDSRSNEVVHKISPIADDDTRFWEGLFAYLNVERNGVMDKITAGFPHLSAADLNFIGLMCCGFSDAAIAVCKNYRNIASVRSRRRKIRDKMGIEGNLTDYIRNITQG